MAKEETTIPVTIPGISETPTPRILIALSKAQRFVKPVQKTSTNQHHGYRYASAEAVITEAREALHGAGLVLIAESWRTIPPVFPDAGQVPRVEVTYLLVHTESGEGWRLPPRATPVVEDRGRPIDKAEAAALTYSLSYLLRGLLLMARVAEGTDVDDRDDGEHAPASFKEALGAAKTANQVRQLCWRNRQRIAEDVDRDTGAPLIVEACKRVRLTPSTAEKIIASIWGDPAPSGDEPAPQET